MRKQQYLYIFNEAEVYYLLSTYFGSRSFPLCFRSHKKN